jgi:hypothetical protein
MSLSNFIAWFLAFLFVIVAAAIAFGYAQTRAQDGEVVALQTLKETLLALLVISASLALVSLLFVLAFAEFFSTWQSALPLLPLIADCMLWSIMITSWIRRRKVDLTLIRIADQQKKVIALITAVVFACLGIVFLTIFLAEFDYILIPMLVNNFTLFVLALFIGLDAIRFTEQGIVWSLFTYSWEQISGYEWEGKRKDKLILRLKQPFLFLNQIMLTVPAAQREEVNQLVVRSIRF